MGKPEYERQVTSDPHKFKELREDALMMGEILLTKKAKQCEEAAELDHLSEEARIEWLQRAAEHRREARMLTKILYGRA